MRPYAELLLLLCFVHLVPGLGLMQCTNPWIGVPALDYPKGPGLSPYKGSMTSSVSAPSHGKVLHCGRMCWA